MGPGQNRGYNEACENRDPFSTPKRNERLTNRERLCVKACAGLTDEQVKEMREFYNRPEEMQEHERLRDAVIHWAMEYETMPDHSLLKEEAESELKNAVRNLRAFQNKVNQWWDAGWSHSYDELCGR